MSMVLCFSCLCVREKELYTQTDQEDFMSILVSFCETCVCVYGGETNSFFDVHIMLLLNLVYMYYFT